MEKALKHFLIASALITTALCAPGGQPQAAIWSDTAGNMKVENWTSWRITKTGDDSYTFKGIGAPFTGTWKEQGLKVRATNVDGKTKKDKKGAMQLVEAKITGVREATLTETNSKGQTRETELKAQSLHFDGTESLVTIPGAVTVISRSPSESQTLTLTGTSARLTLPEFGTKSEWPVKQGTLSGPVTMRLDALERDPDEKKEPRKITVTGTAGKVTFNDEDRTVTLSGGVTLEGTDTLTGGNVRCSRAVITLNEKREIVDIELSGEPGRTEFKDVRGGGR